MSYVVCHKWNVPCMFLLIISHLLLWTSCTRMTALACSAAIHCNKLQHTATHCNTLQHTAAHCSTLQHTATHCNCWLLSHAVLPLSCMNYMIKIPYVYVKCAMYVALWSCHYHFRMVATHCNALQRTATHCNALQHTVENVPCMLHFDHITSTFVC